MGGRPARAAAGSARNISVTAARTGTTVTAVRTAYIDAAMLAGPVRHAVLTGREGTLLVMPGRYTET